MRKICTLVLSCFLLNTALFSQNCNNWLKINNKLDAVTVGDLDVTGNKLTVEASFNATGDITRSLVSKHYYNIDVNYFLVTDNAEITTTNGFFVASAPCSFIKNKTYHIAMVYDGSSLKFYRNGFLMDSVPATGNLITNNWPATIGEFSHALYTNNIVNALPMEGFINEVRIWNVARTQDQIRTNMNSSLPTPGAQAGLLGYYTFENLTNKQGNAAYNGVIHNGATINTTNTNRNFVADSCALATINCNNWLKINNKLDAVTVGDLDVTGNKLTVEASFNATGDITRSLVSKHYYNIDVNYFLVTDNAEITTTNGFFVASAPCSFIKNKTYHIAMVYDGSSLKFYRNGFLMDSVPATGNLITNNWPATIGEFSHALYTNNIVNALPMEGFINEVRIWNVARTQDQIRTNMNSSLPTPGAQAGLLGYYTFENLTNKQGNAAYNGVIHNSAIINSTNPDCDFIADSCIVVLPVLITKFEAIPQNNEVKLSWKTEQEANISHYSIERSENGTPGYQSVGIAYPVQNSVTNTYSFIDQVKPGILYTYRIVIYENSGSKRYSVIKKVIINTKNISLSISPNPTSGLVNYKINNFRGTASVSVSNSMGQVLFTKQVSTASSQNLQLDLNIQAKGTYWIIVTTGDQHFVKKIMHL